MTSKIREVCFWTAWSGAVVFFFATKAHAWGPGTHIECSQFLLESLTLLAPAARALLRKHPHAFTYGALCPDMVLGKRYMRPERNNHNWSAGFNLLHCAASPREEAFALGYLSHLAADTVAHNLFIPDQLLDRFDHRRRGHVMFELIFDVMLEDQVWATARSLSRRRFGECERLMLRSLPPTPLPKKVNQRLFRSGALLIRLGGWEKIVQRLRPRLRREISREVMAPYLAAVHEASLDLLNHREQAACFQRSPTGGAVLAAAEDLRATLRVLDRRRELDSGSLCRVIAAFQKWREETVFPELAAFSQ